MASDDSPETEKLIPFDSEEVEEERAPPNVMKATKKGSVTSDMEVSPALLHDTIDLSSEEAIARVTLRGARDGEFVHHALYPTPSKGYRYARRACGVTILLVLIALVVTAIVMIAIAPCCDLPWWKTAVIYQCYPQSFQDSDGDGWGDLPGIRSRVDHFSNIGVGAVWLNPIFDSPQKDNGYDVSNYTSIYHKYGTLEDFKLLLSELHSKDIRLLLDFVPNHTSDQHPWFLESRKSRDSPKRHWYIWADPKEGGGPPNNWISFFGGSAWTLDNATQQYYLHQFSSYQPDLNYRNESVVQAMNEVLRYWFDMGVDGFRVDAVIFLLEDPNLRDEVKNPEFNDSRCVTNISNPVCYDSLIHNETLNYAGIHDVIRGWRTVAKEYETSPSNEKILVGEIYSDLDTVFQYYGNNSDEFTFPFNFFLLENTKWTGTNVSNVVNEWLTGAPEDGWANWVLGNHDNPRIASKAGVHLARALNTLLLTLPGTPTTYYGEEILMTDVNVSTSQQKDSFEGRDAERTPMQWNTSRNAGFTNPESKPWLPVANNFSKVNVDVESDSTDSILQLYKQLTALRDSSPAFQDGNYTFVNASDEVFSYVRQSDRVSERFLVVINFSEKPFTTNVNVSLSKPTVVLSSALNRTDCEPVDLTQLQLYGGEALVIKGS